MHGPIHLFRWPGVCPERRFGSPVAVFFVRNLILTQTPEPRRDKGHTVNAFTL